MYAKLKTPVLVLLITLFVRIGNSTAQSLRHHWLDLRGLDIQPHLPKYLLSKKSVVFLSVPRSATDPNLRADWKNISFHLHEAFRKMKIDPVRYYYLDHILGNTDLNLSLSAEMTRREIKYIIIVEQYPEIASQVAGYTITITAYNKNATFVSEYQKAWQTTGSDLKTLLSGIRKEIHKAKMNFENFLIPDMPDFYPDGSILKGRRFPVYPRDLKVEKLIVPKFPRHQIEDNTKLTEAVKRKIANYNTEIERKNKRLTQIMSTYPLKYELVETAEDHHIYNQGGQFVLLLSHGSGRSIKTMLNFVIDPFETDYVTIKAMDVGSAVLTLPVEAIVYKYYVKHVHTKDTYMGSKWDADLTWDETLENFIYNMKTALKIKKKRG